MPQLWQYVVGTPQFQAEASLAILCCPSRNYQSCQLSDSRDICEFSNSKYINMQSEITMANYLEREYPQLEGDTLDKSELPQLDKPELPHK